MVTLSQIKNIIQKVDLDLIPEDYKTALDYDGKLIQDRQGRIYKYDASKGKYISETVENILKQFVPSETDFLARIKQNKQQFAGSGFVETPQLEYFRTNIINNTGLFVWKSSDTYFDEKGKMIFPNNSVRGSLLFIDRPFDRQVFYGHTKINVNGIMITLGFLNSNDVNYFGIKLPDPATSLFTIKDSTSLNEDMKQGDFAILKDLDRELVTNGTFDDNIDGWHNGDSDRGSIEYDSDNKRIKVINDGDKDYPNARQTLPGLIKGVKYKVSGTIDIGNADKAKVYISNALGEFITSETTNFEFEFISDGGDIITLYIMEKGNTGHYCYFDNISIKQVEEQPIVAMQDVSEGIDVYENASLFEARDSVSRQDLVFLEVWHEKISEKDIVYPYGNIQYRGSNVEGLTGIVDGDFDGADTYSLFGNWQEPGELVGKGYKWSELSVEDRIKFVSNPENNVYLGNDGEYVQVRFRVRAVKGLGNKWAFVEPKLNNGTAFKYQTGNGYVMAKLSRTSLTRDLSDSSVADEVSFHNPGESDVFPDLSLGTFQAELDDGDNKAYNRIGYAVPIALIQRRNNGIYSPVYNPEGTGKYYYKDGENSKIINWYEINDSEHPENADNEFNLEAMFDPEHIAVYDDDDSSNLASQPDYLRIGYIESQISGRPDLMFADEVNEKDVKDLRTDANKKDYDNILEELKYKLKYNLVRGVENPYNIKIREGISSDYKGRIYLSTSTSNYGIKLADDYKFEIGQNVIFYIVDKGLSNCENGEFLTLPITGVYKNSKRLNYYCQLPDDKIGDLESGAVTMKFIEFTKNNDIDFYSDYQYNRYFTNCEIIGDPRRLKDRIEYTTGDDETIDIHKNMYIYCDDDSDNGGESGHLYRFLKDDITNVHTNDSSVGNANESGGHIDFSDTDYWIDLGTDLEIGSYKEEWLTKGISATPLIIDENGGDLLPVTIGISGTSTNKFRVGRKLVKGLKMYISNKDGDFVDITDSDYDYFNDDYSYIKIENIDDLYSDLGYGSEQEMLDLMKVMVFYTAISQSMELANNTTVLAYDDGMFIDGDLLSTNSPLSIYTTNLINKVNTSGYDTIFNVKWKNLGILRDHINDKYGIPYAQLTADEIVNEITNFSTVSPTVKFFHYLTYDNDKLYLNIMFRELKYDEEVESWGDDGKFTVIDRIAVKTDLNDNNILVGQKRIKLPYFKAD